MSETRTGQENAATASGRTAYHAGRSAEGTVALEYERRWYALVSCRWRGPGGEIDLIVRNAEGVVFVEVKKSRSFAQAAERIHVRQIERVMASAAAFLEGEPDGQLTPVRFDVALVDAVGAVRIIENAFGHV